MKPLLTQIALWLWRTDMSFYQYPYGPPQHGLRFAIAWRLYHWSL
jgi:hypothetical protein